MNDILFTVATNDAGRSSISFVPTLKRLGRKEDGTFRAFTVVDVCSSRKTVKRLQPLSTSFQGVKEGRMT